MLALDESQLKRKALFVGVVGGVGRKSSGAELDLQLATVQHGQHRLTRWVGHNGCDGPTRLTLNESYGCYLMSDTLQLSDRRRENTYP